MRLARYACVALLILGFGSISPARSTAQAKASAAAPLVSRLDLYGGYGFWKPFDGSVAGYNFQKITDLNTTMSLSLFFTNHIGLQVEGQYFSNGDSAAHDAGFVSCRQTACNQSLYTGEAGPIVRFPHGPVTPFVHALFGGARMNGPVDQSLAWGYGFTGGGGIDLNLPYFNNRFSIRPIQADIDYDHVNHGALGQQRPTDPVNSFGGVASVAAVKLSAGVVVHFINSGSDKTPVILGCSAAPIDVYAGDIVTVTGSAVGINPKGKAPSYTWAVDHGVITPAGASATVDTAGLAPGQYTVMGRVIDGPKPYEQAICSAPFNVKPYAPPSILTCSATPSTALPGTPIEISSQGRSPQGRPLKYLFTTTNGQLTVDGPSSARLDTVGLPPGVTTVTCKITDDAGNTATATADVTITNPAPPPPPPSIEPLCSLSFSLDARRPARVDNSAKACLDEVALALNRQADATLVMVGNTAPKEPATFAAERTLNARDYLTKEKGIDPARIKLRVGTSSSKSVNNLLVPAGVTFDVGTSQAFDETSVVRRGQAYPGAHPAKPHHKAKPAAARP